MEELGDDIENITKILPSNITGNWTDNVEFYNYTKKLGSMEFQNVQKERQKLTEESADIIGQTQNLAISNYKKFIETAENTRTIFSEFESTEKKLNDLVEKLPKFDAQIQQFTSECNAISAHRKLSTLMSQKTTQLTEFLQLSELMETCIVDGNYEDALEIVDFVRRFSLKHPDIKIISVVLTQVEKLWLVIVQRLLNQLRSDIQLPKCLQAVGYLRCMNIFSEAELRLKFLQTRDSWLQSLLDEIPKDSASKHLVKTIELSRVNIFHIITQYNAIFSDDMKSSFKTEDDINELAIFQSWIHEKISQFLKTMEQDLNECESSTYGSIISQCVYFALSFSKVGCDFRGLLAPIFRRCIFKHFQTSVQNATNKFKANMESFTLINKVYSISKKDATSTGQDQSVKLEKVQDFYPLAEYCNGLLTAFNTLQITSPLHSVYDITRCVQQSLEVVANIIQTFYKQEHQAFTEIALDQFTLFCECFVYELVPYFQQCIRIIFPPLVVAEHLGVTVQHLEKAKFLSFDRDAILQPIRDLLPIKSDITEIITEDSEIKKEVEQTENDQ